jgi:hypothetical protein
MLADPAHPGQAVLEDGAWVSAETARRLACDASRVMMGPSGAPDLPAIDPAGVAARDRLDGAQLGGEAPGAQVYPISRFRGNAELDTPEPSASLEIGQHPCDVGRRTRTIPPALRRALSARDRSCRFPGCGVRVAEGHHVRHWAHGGPTTLANLALLCRRHHRAVHEEGYRVERDRDGQLRCARPDGRPLPAVPLPVAVRPGTWAAARADAQDSGQPPARPDVLGRRNSA